MHETANTGMLEGKPVDQVVGQGDNTGKLEGKTVNELSAKEMTPGSVKEKLLIEHEVSEIRNKSKIRGEEDDVGLAAITCQLTESIQATKGHLNGLNAIVLANTAL